MKNILTLAILLLAGNAAAQYRAAVPTFPGAGSPVILPKILPNPISGPLAGARIQLPIPTVTPSLGLAVVLPAVARPAPAITARRENIADSVGRVPPTIRISLTAKKEEIAGVAEPRAVEENLDRIFDGTPTQRAGRRINIPEREMEQELGL